LEPFKCLIVSVTALELYCCFYCQEFFNQHHICEIAAICPLEAIYPDDNVFSLKVLFAPSCLLSWSLLFHNKENSMRTNESNSGLWADTQYSCTSAYLKIYFLLSFLLQSFCSAVYVFWLRHPW